MTVWTVDINEKFAKFGSKKRIRLSNSSSACNEPYLGRFWCPRRKWFMTSECPFAGKSECDSFRRMCGSL